MRPASAAEIAEADAELDLLRKSPGLKISRLLCPVVIPSCGEQVTFREDAFQPRVTWGSGDAVAGLSPVIVLDLLNHLIPDDSPRFIACPRRVRCHDDIAPIQYLE